MFCVPIVRPIHFPSGYPKGMILSEKVFAMERFINSEPDAVLGLLFSHQNSKVGCREIGSSGE